MKLSSSVTHPNAVRGFEVFKQKVLELSDRGYDYSKVVYVNTRTKVEIVCPKHGSFFQYISQVKEGQGCPKCGKHNRLTKTKFIQKAVKTHKHKYDYKKTIIRDCEGVVIITCKVHGDFKMKAGNHMNGGQCRKCTKKYGTYLTSADFIIRAKKQHKNKYDYSEVQYVDFLSPVKIRCKKHGFFMQTPDIHYRARVGCQKCANVGDSKVEKELRKYIKKFVKVKANTRKIIEPYELDIYVPSHNLAFEFNGLYHHTERTKPNDYHKMKTDMCKAKGVRLVHIFEDDWRDNKKKIKKFIKHLLGFNKKKTIYARKTVIRDIDVAEARPFLDKHHIQGFGRASTHLGMFFEGKLVAVTSFKKGQSNTNNKDMFELTRHATSNIVIGSLGKMTKFFQRTYHNHIYTFCDNSFFSGDSYLKAGYLEVGEIKPDYKYAVNGKREHKFTWRLKDIKIKKPDIYSKDKSEKEMMLEAKIYRIYDCGKTRFEIT